MTDRVPEPYWIEEIKREIKRLDNAIRRLEKLRDQFKLPQVKFLDLFELTGRRDALKWALKMRDGKSSRKQAWGKEE